METPTERHYFLRDLHTYISGGQSVSTFRGPLSLASPRSQDQFITHSPSPWTPKAALEWGCEPIRSHPCSEAQSGIRNQNPEALTLGLSPHRKTPARIDTKPGRWPCWATSTATLDHGHHMAHTSPRQPCPHLHPPPRSLPEGSRILSPLTRKSIHYTAAFSGKSSHSLLGSGHTPSSSAKLTPTTGPLQLALC